MKNFIEKVLTGYFLSFVIGIMPILYGAILYELIIKKQMALIISISSLIPFIVFFSILLAFVVGDIFIKNN